MQTGGLADLRTYRRSRICDGTFEFLLNFIRRVGEKDRACRIAGLAHLFRRIGERHDAGPDLGDDGLGHGEQVTEPVVEPLRQVAGQLQVLGLVIPHRHGVGAVDEDVGGHQDRIGEQPELLTGLVGLLLVLRHTFELSHPGERAEDPGQLGVLGHIALVIEQ